MGRRARMRRLREDDVDELLEQAEPAAEQEAPAQSDTPVARTLELQKTAGNRAVGTALARWPMLFTGSQAQWPKEPQVIIDGAAIPMLSFSWSESESGASGGGGGPGKADMREMNISIRPTTHSAKLGVGSARGQHYKTVIIVMPKGGGGNTITLKDVLITRYSAVGDVDTFTVNFARYELGTSPPRS